MGSQFTDTIAYSNPWFFSPSVNLNENHREVGTDNMPKMFRNGKNEQFPGFQ